MSVPRSNCLLKVYTMMRPIDHFENENIHFMLPEVPCFNGISFSAQISLSAHSVSFS